MLGWRASKSDISTAVSWVAGGALIRFSELSAVRLLKGRRITSLCCLKNLLILPSGTSSSGLELGPGLLSTSEVVFSSSCVSLVSLGSFGVSSFFLVSSVSCRRLKLVKLSWNERFCFSFSGEAPSGSVEGVSRELAVGWSGLGLRSLWLRRNSFLGRPGLGCTSLSLLGGRSGDSVD